MTRRASLKPQAPKSEEYATFHIEEKQYKIPILEGNDGEKLLDIQALYA